MKNFHLTTIIMLAALTFIGVGCASSQKKDLAVPVGSTDSTATLTARDDENTPKATGDSGQGTVDTGSDAAMKVQPSAEVTAAPTPAVPKKFPGVLAASEIHGKVAHLKTDKGDIVFALLDSEAPKTVSNFVALARSKYFDGLTFHRVVPGFVIQGGDPVGNGTGGPGYQFEDEPVKLDYKAGIVAMANAGPNTNGSQFFIVLEDQPTLPKAYTIFGRVTKGMSVVQAIKVGDHMQMVSIEKE